jgi:hypothetical protein
VVNFISEKDDNLPFIATGVNPLSISGNRTTRIKADKFLYLAVLLPINIVTYSGLAWILNWMTGFIEHSLVVTTNNYNTLKITVTVSHKIKSSTSAC